LHILLGISASIAAYKTPDLIRQLGRSGIEVSVVMTKNAQAFVTPLSLAAVCQNRVYTSETLLSREDSFIHLDLPKHKAAMIIAPASADIIAKLAHGFADDLLTATCLSFTGPKIIIPAMHQEMWENKITQANIQTLLNFGFKVLGPGYGDLACGDTGYGRMIDLDQITFYCQTLAFPPLNFKGQRLLISAGGTQEPLDTVRVLTNRSTGMLGHAIALLAGMYDAEVHLVSTSPLAPTPFISTHTHVTTTSEMASALEQSFPYCDHLVMAAAVSDFSTPYSSTKIQRNQSLHLDLHPTKDIIAGLGKIKTHQKITGFCLADSARLEAIAREKLQTKNLDAIVANTSDNIGAPTRSFLFIQKDLPTKKITNASLVESAYQILALSLPKGDQSAAT